MVGDDTKSLMTFLVEAIEEVAPGQGQATYWRAFDLFEEYSIQRDCGHRLRPRAKAADLLEVLTQAPHQGIVR